MPRVVQFGKNLIDLDAVSAVMLNEDKGFIELVVGGQPVVFHGKERALALFGKLVQSLKPIQQWETPGTGTSTDRR